MKIKYGLIFTVLIISNSCNYTEIRRDDKEDLASARQFMKNYYELVKNGEYEKASNLVGGERTPEEARVAFLKANKFFGDLESYEEVNAISEITIEKDKKTGRIDLEYSARHTLEVVKEYFILTVDNDKITMIGFEFTLLDKQMKKDSVGN